VLVFQRRIIKLEDGEEEEEVDEEVTAENVQF
jgi:hypothetical protein